MDIVERLKRADWAQMGAREDCRAAAAEIERLRALTTWQPIKTAPKDGTEIDIWVIDEADFVIDDFPHGYRIPDAALVHGRWRNGNGVISTRTITITHWRHITPPEDRT